MISFLIQFIFLFLVVIFQVSFLNAFFSYAFLNVLLATVIALVLTRGFFSTWPWVVCLGCLFDIITLNVVGVTPLVLILFSYGISFLSRRFLVEHKASGTGLAILYMAVSSVAYFPLVWIVRHLTLSVPLSIKGISEYFLTTPLLFGMILNTILFLMMYVVMLKINRAIDFYEDRVVVKR
jgi:hypothetical protein